MKYVPIDSIETGQYLGKTIFSGNGAVLLAEGVQLTVYMITTLRRIGVTMLYIQDPLTEDIELPEVVSDETKRIVMKKMQDTLSTIRSGKDFDSRSLSISIDTLLNEIMKNSDVLIQLTDIRTKDNDMYLHALNVCTISTLIGINMGLNQLQLKELATGALLHDIGKMDAITDDKSPDERLHHTWRGFELLKHKREYSLLIAHVAFQHHETPDGLGQPRRLLVDQIHLYARIVSVANTYDNLLRSDELKTGMLPHVAIEHMMALAGTKLDREVLIQFLRTVSIYSTGTSVRLSSRETGVVVGQHRGLPGRPIVRIVKQEGGSDLEVKEVDLAQHTTIFIEHVLG
ncbi:HD-GYP domain-containing protein [Paenibacillus lutrae]|uniref:HD domain-containing protein n=1 Tax=Paenibacillus lutrae TaxID=2078573 RepID=A0A7X3FHA6_9BACL|nr:HD domain-containing phosphohydrolase [Paenibacillus lutrae]MVO99775.1 HD domain-containing protein [Paenibacillus lutrae]